MLPKAVREPRIKWKILPVVWLSLKRMAMVLGFMVLINILLALIVLPAFMPKKGAVPNLPDEMVLFLKFEDGLNELPERAGLSDPFSTPRPTVDDIVKALDMAAGDKRVKGVLARMYDGNFDLAHIAEIRAALMRFRGSGKFAHIYSSSYGEGGGGLSRYYLASAFDEIWMQPLGIVSITGVGAEVPFFRETLNKIGVEPQFFKRKDYKTAYESLTDADISPENKEMLGRIVGDIRSEMISTIPVERGMSVQEFERLVNKGLLTAPEAEKAGLITKADYGDVLLDNVAQRVTGERDADKLNLVNMDGYIGVMKKKASGLGAGAKPKVALVYAVGAIMPSGEDGGFGGENIAAADKIAPAIFEAAKDDDVKAIVLRIDSPGGSPSASESILRAVEKAQEAGKPVIVSMGPTAASGGYWIAAYADKIYALPTTLTGSIGVVGGKFALGELSDKLGVNWAKVTWGKNAGMWSLVKPFSTSEAERMNTMLDHVYDSFVARVAKGRDMTPAEVDKVAGGRVWTGRRALEAGLVDELGGLNEALIYTANLIGEQGRGDINVSVFPAPKTPIEQLLELLGTQARMGQAVKLQERVLEAVSPFLQSAEMNARPVSAYEAIRLSP